MLKQQISTMCPPPLKKKNLRATFFLLLNWRRNTMHRVFFDFLWNWRRRVSAVAAAQLHTHHFEPRLPSPSIPHDNKHVGGWMLRDGRPHQSSTWEDCTLHPTDATPEPGESLKNTGISSSTGLSHANQNKMVGSTKIAPDKSILHAAA